MQWMYTRLGNQGMRDACCQLVEAQDFVERRVLHDAFHQREVHRMTGFFRDHMAQQRFSDQRQVADQIESLMPAAFVAKRRPPGFSTELRSKQTAFSSDAPRIRPMLRIWSSSYSKPNVRAGAISAA